MGRKRNPKLEQEAFEVYERIRPVVEEFLDNWMVVGKRAGCGTKIMIGTSHKGWGDMQGIYEAIQEWKHPEGDKESLEGS